MADGHPERWGYFEDLNVIDFLNLCLYYKDKQEENIRIMKLNSK